MQTRELAEMNAAADSMKAELTKFRESELIQLCADCDNEAKPDSCYCQRCENLIYAE